MGEISGFTGPAISDGFARTAASNFSGEAAT
jgi:hypothetical protein